MLLSKLMVQSKLSFKKHSLLLFYLINTLFWLQSQPFCNKITRFRSSATVRILSTHPIYFLLRRDRLRASSYSRPPRSWTDCTKTRPSPVEKWNQCKNDVNIQCAPGRSNTKKTDAELKKTWSTSGFTLSVVHCSNINLPSVPGADSYVSEKHVLLEV